MPVRRLERGAARPAAKWGPPFPLALLFPLALMLSVVLAGCSVTVADPEYTPPPPLPALEQLKQAPLTVMMEVVMLRCDSATD